ncbi:GNAT family N-acetyltransferase [Comamonas sp.]|uniref:GNAT family N-acetyltransferase n=1 Tax=Comamonas sp. TaxID=34028 RepID=UPI003A920869
MSAITVRSAQTQDAVAIAALLKGIGWFKAHEQATDEQALQAVAALIAAPHASLLLVAEHASQGICGYCAVHWLPSAVLLGWEAYVSELFVADSARGLGAGTLLLNAAAQAARERRCQRIWLVNNRERPSYQRGFYQQQGWTEQAEMARFVLPLNT